MTRTLPLTFALCLAASACSSSDDDPPASPPDGGAGDAAPTNGNSRVEMGIDAAPVDLAPDRAMAVDLAPDLAPDRTAPSVGIGRACANDGECGAGLFCLDEGEDWPGPGYCTLPGCLTDDECGADAFCSAPIGQDRFQLCILRCAAGASCANSAYTCSQKLGGALDLGQPGCVPGKVTAKDGDACKDFSECRGSQVCLRNPFNAPDGMCVTLGCTPGNNATCAPGGDGVCLPFGATGLCLDSCQAPTDCRMAQSYTCADDPADALPGLCAHASKEPGTACAASTDCGPRPWECLTGPTFPGGYCGGRGCTVGDEATCPFDTLCHDPDPNQVNDQYCVRTCTTDNDCRGAEGYTCQALVDGMGAKGCKLRP